MNSIFDIDDYDTYNFHYQNKYEQTRPLELTTQTQIYNLLINEKGNRQFVYDRGTGKPIGSPRSLLMLCVNNLIQNDSLIQKLNEKTVSTNIFSLVFKEAVQFGELSLIAHLVSIWPCSCLKLSELISSEIISSDSLSKPLFQNGPTIIDYVLLGILITRSCSRLKTIDFTGFHSDLKLTKEICHLTLLWFSPRKRSFENIYSKIKSRCYFNEFSLSRYLENFNEIYSEYDLLIQHETNLDQMHLIIDCHINCEDVTLGLALQYHTPFRFHAKKLWCSYGFTESEYSFKNYDILSLINPNHLTHLCLKDLFMIETPADILNLCSILESFNNLTAISLIRVLNFYPSNYSNVEIHEVCTRLNQIFKRNYKLKKLDLSFNFIRSRLVNLLKGLLQPIEYLNLQDCRLDAHDLAFLSSSQMSKSLRACRDLNLSMNDFSQIYSNVFSLIANCNQLNCLNISHCKIATNIICQQLVNNILLVNKSLKLKVIYVQPFVPPLMSELVELLSTFSQIKSLQKFYFMPSIYTFPGSTETERELAAIRVIKICCGILQSKGRSDIEFINL